MTEYPKRLIEVDLPIKRISAHARREKSIRHGHISTLHIWWARRPLAACRAVLCAALWPDPADENCSPSFREAAARLMQEFSFTAAQERSVADLCDPITWGRLAALRQPQGQLDPANPDHLNFLRFLLLDFIADFANWDSSTEPHYLATARALTQAAHEALGGLPGTRPLVVDPFAGGGAIPLEALRVGADAFASDLNPVAVLLNKVVLEYIPKYGQRLADEVRKWGKEMRSIAKDELAEFYPQDNDGSRPVAYLWARTIRCEGPGCGTEIPLIRSLWLSKRKSHPVALKIIPDLQKKQIGLEIIENARARDVGEGTVRRSSATCPICGYTTSDTNVRKQFDGRRGGASDARLLAVVTTKIGVSGKCYRLANHRDIEVIQRAAEALSSLSIQDPDIVPNEPLPYLRSIFNIHLLDVRRWGDLYSSRQMLALATLMHIVRQTEGQIRLTTPDTELAVAVVTCLALAVDRVAAQCNSLSWWQPNGEFVVGAFGRQALGIIWDFAEIRPVAGASGDLDGAIDWIARVLESLVDSECDSGSTELASATEHPLPNDSATAIVTDPPYYDAVPYADLSDFFYVLLKRMLWEQHPSLFSSHLTPKHGEIVQLAERNKDYAFKTKEYFEVGMRDALAEARRVVAPSGLSVVIFAHKTTEGWEAMLSSLIDSGWVVTASWPIDTERAVRMRAYQSAALASSIHIVCRPRENPDGSLRINAIGEWRDVLDGLPRRIHEWMPRLAQEGIVGADAIFACLGPALEIYSRYSRVERADGTPVPMGDVVDKRGNVVERGYLSHVWEAVSHEALSMIFEDADTAGFEADARLTAMWLWTLSTADGAEVGSNGKVVKSQGYTLEYDAARKIAQGLGAHLDQLGNLVEIKGDQARLLPVAERTQA